MVPNPVAAEPMAATKKAEQEADAKLAHDAEVTALTSIIDMHMWQPLALGFAPPNRVVCDGCRAFIAERGGHVAADYRTAVWW